MRCPALELAGCWVELGLSFEMEISGRAFAVWYYMELGGIWWINVLNSALPPQRHSPDTRPAHPNPVSHTAEYCWNYRLSQAFTGAFFYGFSIQQMFLFHGWADLTTTCLATYSSHSLTPQQHQPVVRRHLHQLWCLAALLQSRPARSTSISCGYRARASSLIPWLALVTCFDFWQFAI